MRKQTALRQALDRPVETAMLVVLGSGRLAAASAFELGGCTSAATCFEQPVGFVEARAGQPVLLVVASVGATLRYLAVGLASFA